jgi:thymidylate synthase (FAD)
MKIVKPSVKLVHCTPDPERVIERMGRICYQSDHKVKPCAFCDGTGRRSIGGESAPCGSCIESVPCGFCNSTGTDVESAVAFVKMIVRNGHESVLEHASAGFSIVTDRGVTHEIVRHRLASYSQESTRYCNYANEKFGGEITVVQPPGLDTCNQARYAWEASMLAAEENYNAMVVGKGISPQVARGVLPNSLKAEIGMTANFREWRHFLRLRTSSKAHPQMREVAEMVRAELLKLSRACFEDVP